MGMSGKKLADRLDWNAMLGFQQVAENRSSLRSGTSQRLGAKVGEKPGIKPTITIGSKIGLKTGQKPTGQL
jgi:hypothetical protein